MRHREAWVTTSATILALALPLMPAFAPAMHTTRTAPVAVTIGGSVETINLIASLAARYGAVRSTPPFVVSGSGTRYGVEDTCTGANALAMSVLYLQDPLLHVTPFSDPRSSCSSLINIPIAVGAVPVVYNLTGAYFERRRVDDGMPLHPLRLTARVLASIYLGLVTRWDDPAIARLNPGAPLPAATIIAFHGIQGDDGADILFSDWLAEFDSRWMKAVGMGVQPRWPVGPNLRRVEYGHTASPPVSMQRTPYSLGFVGLDYALTYKLQTAALMNASGAFVLPSPNGLAAAATAALHAGMPSDFRKSFLTASGSQTFDPSFFVFLVVRRTPAPYADPAVRPVAKDFLTWALDPRGGQAFVASFGGYRPIACAVGGGTPVPCALAAAARALADSVALSAPATATPSP